LYSASGILVKADDCYSDTYILKKNNLAPGLYFLVSEETNVTYKIKIIIL
jgi:hypothetical protein